MSDATSGAGRTGGSASDSPRGGPWSQSSSSSGGPTHWSSPPSASSPSPSPPSEPASGGSEVPPSAGHPEYSQQSGLVAGLMASVRAVSAIAPSASRTPEMRSASTTPASASTRDVAASSWKKTA